METCTDTNNVDILPTLTCVAGNNNTTVVREEPSDLKLTINKKEFNVVGDDLYIPKLYNDAPQWLKDLVNIVVQVGVEANNETLLKQTQELVNTLANITVPLNTYTQSILALNTEDSRLNSAIETLNSNLTNGLNSANAQIIGIKQTYVSKDEANTVVTGIISSQLNNGVLDSVATVGDVSTALATETEARALDYTTLESAIAGESEAQAQATQTIRTYVGIDEVGAGTGTGLSAYLEASDGTIGGADSQVTNDIRISAESVEAKWAYNSVVNINGVYKKSGFGLTTNYISGNGTENNPYTSEFWIDASKFKFTNSNQTGSVSPFTIDATGSVPQVYFNGIVEFAGLGINSNSTTISGDKITTGTIDASKIVAEGLDASIANIININASNITTGTLNADYVTIKNLKVLGTALLPGISKMYSFYQGNYSMPDSTLDNGSPNYSYGQIFSIQRPYECNHWSSMVIVTVTNDTGTGDLSDLVVDLEIGGQWYSSVGTSSYQIQVTLNGVYANIPGGLNYINTRVRVWGYHSYGVYNVRYSVIAMVED